MVKIVTIGVYGFEEDMFFDALQGAGVQVLVDVRWRRGVRGSDYAFANHKRLQARLEALGIVYIYRRDLAPSPEIRIKQMKADAAEKVAKRKRQTLSPSFVETYREGVLSSFDPQVFLEELPQGTKVAALFCVEREPAACHRVLIADQLCALEGVMVEHLFPHS